jgi:hypothetical protein
MTCLEAELKSRTRGQSRDKSTPQRSATEHPYQQTTTQATLISLDPNQLNNSLKLFMPKSSGKIETPVVERFLTPGFSDPGWFARLTLASINTPFGDADAMGEREQMAKLNVEQLVRNSKKK